MWFLMNKNFKNQMNFLSLQFFIRLFILLTLPLFFVGCFTASPDDDRMPQGRPASWEYSLPGGFDRGMR